MTQLLVILSLLVIFSFNLTIEVSALDVTAASCSETDIQAAADLVEAAGGGTVYIPAGTCSHTEKIKIPDGISLIGAGQNKTIISDGDVRINTRFYGKLDKGFRISGISFINGSYIQIDSCHDFRIDHCIVEGCGGSAIGIRNSVRGVVDHCKLSQCGNYYGVTVTGSDVWENDITNLLGSADAIFVEDCDFGPGGHFLVGHGAAHYVARHNVFHDAIGSAVDAHGPGYGPTYGTRCVEVYENVFQGSGMGIRGGGGVIFGNTINQGTYNISLVLESGSAPPYPVPGQVHDMWIWDNTIDSDEEHIKVSSWSGQQGLAEEMIQKDRDFFLREPTQEPDGFTYTPYPYPHPFVADGDTEPPNPPTGLRIER